MSKVTDVLNKVFIAVSIISAVTVIIGLVVISSAIIVQGKIKIFQNLIFKILGFSKKEIIMSSIIEFVISFLSIPSSIKIFKAHSTSPRLDMPVDSIIGFFNHAAWVLL